MHEEMDLLDLPDPLANIEAEEQESAVMRTGQNSESRWVRNPEVAWPYNSTYEDRMHKV